MTLFEKGGDPELLRSFEFSDSTLRLTSWADEDSDDTAGAPLVPLWDDARRRTAFRRRSPESSCRAAIGRPLADVHLASRLLERLGTSVRDDQVRSVRLALAEDSYENALKVEVAIDRLLLDLESL